MLSGIESLEKLVLVVVTLLHSNDLEAVLLLLQRLFVEAVRPLEGPVAQLGATQLVLDLAGLGGRLEVEQRRPAPRREAAPKQEPANVQDGLATVFGVVF